jgi:hypothetical protein
MNDVGNLTELSRKEGEKVIQGKEDKHSPHHISLEWLSFLISPIIFKTLSIWNNLEPMFRFFGTWKSFPTEQVREYLFIFSG